MSASKIAHRRLSGRAGSITQPITIAADVDRGAELIEVCRATPLDEARALALLRGATAADLRKRETEYGNAPHIVLCVYHDSPAVLEAMLQIVSDPDAKNGVDAPLASQAANAQAALGRRPHARRERSVREEDPPSCCRGTPPSALMSLSIPSPFSS